MKIIVPVFLSIVFALAIIYLLRPLNAGAVVLVFILCAGFVALVSLAFKTKKDDADAIIDTIKKVVEIFAIIAAGLWAYFTFLVKDEPSLHRESTITTEITVDSVNHKMHLSNFVTIKNNGKSSFDVVEPVCIEVWLIPIDTLTKTTYFDWEAYMGKTPPDTSVVDTIYKGPYSPNDSIKISHDFFMGKAYNDKARYTVLARAATGFKSSGLFGHDAIIRDYAYDVKMRYKSVDGGSVTDSGKNKRLLPSPGGRNSKKTMQGP